MSGTVSSSADAMVRSGEHGYWIHHKVRGGYVVYYRDQPVSEHPSRRAAAGALRRLTRQISSGSHVPDAGGERHPEPSHPSTESVGTLEVGPARAPAAGNGDAMVRSAELSQPTNRQEPAMKIDQERVAFLERRVGELELRFNDLSARWMVFDEQLGEQQRQLLEVVRVTQDLQTIVSTLVDRILPVAPARDPRVVGPGDEADEYADVATNVVAINRKDKQS